MNDHPRSVRAFANGLDHHVLEWMRDAAEQPSLAGDVTPDGTAVLLHGYMDAAGTWDLVAPALARAGLRVLAPDMRGFGDGPRAPRGSYYHFADYVADVADLIASLVKGPLFLVGHSMGGTVASLFAGAFPERVTKLALLEGVGPPDNPPAVAPDRMRAWIEQIRLVRDSKVMANREDALRRLILNHPGVDPEVLRHRLPHLVREIEGGKVAWRYDPLHRTTSPTAFFSAVYREFAGRVTSPVLVVGGGATGFHPPDEEERYASFRTLERLDLEDAGHMMHWTRPRELSEALLRFWRGHR